MQLNVPGTTRLIIMADDWQFLQDEVSRSRKLVKAMTDEFARLGLNKELDAVLAAMEGCDGDAE